MKTAIVYYSMTGNTEYTVKRIAEMMEADLISLKPCKEYPSQGARKFLWGGKSAIMGECPKLLPYEFEKAKYDRIVIATPVWAGTFAPPIRTFLKEHSEIRKKKLAIVTCSGGDGVEKVIDKMMKFMKASQPEATLNLLDPKENKKEEDMEKIREFCCKLSKSTNQ